MFVKAILSGTVKVREKYSEPFAPKKESYKESEYENSIETPKNSIKLSEKEEHEEDSDLDAAFRSVSVVFTLRKWIKTQERSKGLKRRRYHKFTL
jgi:hypothetical protein